jgi:hypothetical protein
MEARAKYVEGQCCVKLKPNADCLPRHSLNPSMADILGYLMSKLGRRRTVIHEVAVDKCLFHVEELYATCKCTSSRHTPTPDLSAVRKIVHHRPIERATERRKEKESHEKIRCGGSIWMVVLLLGGVGSISSRQSGTIFS